MALSRYAALLAGAALLTACEARIGNDAPPVEANASAAGKAEEGRLTVSAPGFDMSIDIPESVQDRADVESDNGLVYPGANLGGIHIQGSGHDERGQNHGEVELRFTTADAPDRVVGWYRDPARGSEFTIQSGGREGNAFVVNGTGRRDDERFTLRLAPRAGGGTEGRLVLSDTNR